MGTPNAFGDELLPKLRGRSFPVDSGPEKRPILQLCTGVDSKYAVFDKIVPGYYHRRTEAGDLCTSACCNNTAPEHLMFERLIVDDIVHWACTYKVSSCS